MITEPSSSKHAEDILYHAYGSLRDEQTEASKVMNKAVRDTATITNEMRIEVMELLEAFRLPYIIAPYEAEAQCAVLEKLGLVDGIVTDDSDAFLFGGRHIYKNIFIDSKFVEAYHTDDVLEELGLEREDLVAFAYFLGSDYTDGVRGVGLVNAMEILSSFPMKKQYGGPIGGLKLFKKWLSGHTIHEEVMVAQKSCASVDEDDKVLANILQSIDDLSLHLDERQVKTILAFHKNHKHHRKLWNVQDTFPDEKIADEYLNPRANYLETKFTWQIPDLQRLHNYCTNRLGWSHSDIHAKIVPVVDLLAHNSQIQSRIDSYFYKYDDAQRFAKIKSRRLLAALEKTNSDNIDSNLSVVAGKNHVDDDNCNRCESNIYRDGTNFAMSTLEKHKTQRKR